MIAHSVWNRFGRQLITCMDLAYTSPALFSQLKTESSAHHSHARQASQAKQAKPTLAKHGNLINWDSGAPPNVQINLSERLGALINWDSGAHANLQIHWSEKRRARQFITSVCLMSGASANFQISV